MLRSKQVKYKIITMMMVMGFVLYYLYPKDTHIVEQITKPLTEPLSANGRSLLSIHCSFAPVDCSNHGVCNQEGSGCICNDGYLTYPSNSDPQCNYEQKSQTTAFLLSFFLGYVGAGRLYIGQFTLGVIKLCLIFIVCGIGCILQPIFSYLNVNEDTNKCLMDILASTGKFAIVLWWLIDVILFGINDIDDDNGIELESW
tara:strand:+ start:45 stop:644 length:600 start_codon:yes stop_codon:yes gene_type:complete